MTVSITSLGSYLSDNVISLFVFRRWFHLFVYYLQFPFCIKNYRLSFVLFIDICNILVYNDC